MSAALQICVHLRNLRIDLLLPFFLAFFPAGINERHV
jgi:hypothetical protein